jgi:predicted kinase
MEKARPTTLYLLCGKICAGKSTLARHLAAHPAILLISMDHWMSTLFPTENRTIDALTESRHHGLSGNRGAAGTAP